MRTRTLANLRADVCDRADVTDGGASGRHTSSRLNRYINQAIQKYYNMAAKAGGQEYFMKRSTVTGSTSTTEDSAGWTPNQYIALPSDFASLVGIDITVGGTTYPLMQFDRIERDQFIDNPGWAAGDSPGRPVYYRIGGTNQAGSQIAQVIPAMDSAYVFEIWYMPAATDLSSDSDTLDGVAGLEEYVVNRAALDVLINDGNTATPLYAAILRDLGECESNVKAQFGMMAQPGRRKYTAGYRERGQLYARKYWPL